MECSRHCDLSHVPTQVLLTEKSVAVQSYMKNKMPVLRQLTQTKMAADQARTVCDILHHLAQ